MSDAPIKFHKSLTGRILLVGVLPTVAILTGIIIYTTINMYAAVRESTEMSLRTLGEQVATEIDRGNTRAVLAAKVMALAQAHGLFGRRPESSAYARQVLAEFPEFTGAYFGYEANADGSDEGFLNTDEARTLREATDSNGRFLPYWFRDQEDNQRLLLEPLVNMETSLYYQGAKNLFNAFGEARPMVTEPYVYEGKMIVEQTYPIVLEGDFKGIAGVDRALSDIEAFLNRIKQRELVDVFLISGAGRFIATTTDEDGELKTKDIQQTTYAELFAPIYQSTEIGTLDIATDPKDGDRYYFASAQVPTGNWRVILRKAERDVIAPLQENLVSVATLALAGLTLVVLLSLGITTSASRRIRQAVEAADHLASGDLSQELRLSLGAQDEVGRMSRSFNRVMDSYREITTVCKAFAVGDYSKRLDKRCNNDILAEAINTMAVKRERAEEALRDSKERLDLALRSSGIGIWEWDALHDRIYWDDTIHALYGMEAGSYSGTYEDYRKRLHADDRARVEEEIGAIMESGSELQTEYRVIWPDGSVHALADRSRVFRNDEGRIVRMIGVNWDVTERRREEEKFRALFEYSSEAHLIFDESGIIDCNQAAVKLFGCTKKSKLVGVPPQSLSPETQPDGRRSDEKGAAMNAAAFEQGYQRFDWVHRRTNGETFPVEVTITPIVLNEKRVMLGVLHDLTERKQAEEELRKLSRAIEQSPASVIITDSNGLIEYVNPKFFEMTGFSATEAIGETPRILKSGQQSDEYYQQLWSTILAGKEWHGEIQNRKKNGELYWQRSSISPIRSSEGAITHFVGVQEDVTEHIRMEQALRESQEFLRGVIDNTTALVYAKDADGRYLLINRKWKQLLNLSEEEVIGRTDRELFPFEMAEVYRANDRKVLESGEPISAEETAVVGDTERTFLSVKFPIVDSEGIVRTVCGMSTDITKLKQTEAELRRARVLADEASEAKSSFLANMSHEIRTPLNGIIGFTTLALRTDLTTQQQDYLHKIHVSSNTLLNLINDILDFSKIEAGKLNIEHIDFQLQHLLEELADMFADQAARKDIELAIARRPDTPSALVGDPLRLRQVLVNLLSNAIKFTDQGEIFLEVHALDGSNGKVRLHFSVRDSGIGITSEQVSRLFDSFTQADGSTTRKYGGTGLGLAISKQLVELMGGKIGVESEPGRGSTFWVEIPFERQDAANEPIYSLRVDLRGLKVLVVDDNALSQQVLVEMLSSFGFDVDTAAGGEEALGNLLSAVAENRPYDVVLMDWKMPGLDGLSTSTQIRHNEQLAEVPIVMVTAFGREQERQEGGRIGVDAFLTKPVQQSVLFNTLMEVFGEAQQKVALGRPMVTAETLRANKLTGTQILLVEDNPINQELAENLLRSEGIEVEIANNGLEAIDKICQRRYDAVLMDMQMPELDGYEATRKIREDKRLDQLPIIAMTAHALEGDRDKCLKAGTNDYISKPIEPEQLFEVLRKWISPNRRGAATSELGARTSKQGTVGIAELDGFDVADALSRLRGNQRLYEKLLRDFAREHSEDGLRIQGALNAGQRDRARALAHTLKGIAGNLSAKDLHAAAAQLESTIAAMDQTKPGELQSSLDRVNQSLEHAITTVQRLEGDEESDQTQVLQSEQESPLHLDQAVEVGREVREAAEIGNITKIQQALEALPETSNVRQKLTRLAESFDLDGLKRAATELEQEGHNPHGS